MRGLFGSLSDGALARSTATSTDTDGWFHNWATGGGHSTAGVSVTVDSSMRLSAVWACVRVRSEDVGKLPCFLYRRLKGGGKERALDHHLYSLIRDQPNPRMTAFEFRQLMQARIDLRGNAYAVKEYDNRGRVVALWPVCPTKVTVLMTADQRELFYKINGLPEALPAEAIIHLRGMSLDGCIGVSPITYHRETIGLAIAAQQYGAAFFGNSAQPLGGLKVPSVLSIPAAAALRESWEQRHKSAENAKKLAIFDGGMEWVQTGMNNTDAQYLETRGFQNREIWRMYRMPPHKVGDLDKATNNNIEHQGLEYVTDCLLPELVRWEQTLARDLLTEAERKEYFFEHLVDGLLRGDIKSRYEAYAIARMWGAMNADEWREKENQNPIPDGKGRIYLQPLNYIEAGSPIPPPISPGGAKALLAYAKELVARQELESHD